MNLILFCLISLGITNIIVRENIFEWLRVLIDKYFKYSYLNKAIRCETCAGFWVGALISIFFTPISPILIVNSIFYGAISSIINKIILIILFKF